VRTSGLGGGASTRGHVGTVLEVLTILPISIFSLKPPATSGFAARTVDAKPYSVVSHLSRIRRASGRALTRFLLSSRFGPRHSATVRVNLSPCGLWPFQAIVCD
jgi:hypothetical protein